MNNHIFFHYLTLWKWWRWSARPVVMTTSTQARQQVEKVKPSWPLMAVGQSHVHSGEQQLPSLYCWHHVLTLKTLEAAAVTPWRSIGIHIQTWRKYFFRFQSQARRKQLPINFLSLFFLGAVPVLVQICFYAIFLRPCAAFLFLFLHLHVFGKWLASNKPVCTCVGEEVWRRLCLWWLNGVEQFWCWFYTKIAFVIKPTQTPYTSDSYLRVTCDSSCQMHTDLNKNKNTL